MTYTFLIDLFKEGGGGEVGEGWVRPYTCILQILGSHAGTYQIWKNNGLRRPFMTVLDVRNIRMNARKSFAKLSATVTTYV